MSVFSSVKARQPGRFISDLEVPDTIWKADFDIVDRYQSFANELMRVALLGIAAYGFLIKEVCLSENSNYSVEKMFTSLAGFGLCSLTISLIFALIHRFFSTSCLFYQILIIRSLKRLENQHWSDADKDLERDFLKYVREAQRNKSRASHSILIATVVFFAIGFILMIPAFGSFFVNSNH